METMQNGLRSFDGNAIKDHSVKVTSGTSLSGPNRYGFATVEEALLSFSVLSV